MAHNKHVAMIEKGCDAWNEWVRNIHEVIQLIR